MTNATEHKPGFWNALRRALGVVRRRTSTAGRVAGRLSAVSRYAFDLVLWSRIAARPSELAQRSRAMRKRGINLPAPALFVLDTTDRARVWQEAFEEAYRLLMANLQVADLISARRYARPSPAFQGVYLWDSAFIAQIWKWWDPDVASDVCLAVVDQADEAGRLPHVTAHFVESAFTQPPLIAWSLWKLHEWRRDKAARRALAYAWPRLCAYSRWMDGHRRLDNGLYFWKHPYESGVENAPRFSSRDERRLEDTTVLAAPDLSSYVVLQNEALAAIADVLGHSNETRSFAARADELRATIDEHLWHEGDELYYDLNVRTNTHVRSATIASLMPLWAGAATGDRAARLAEHAIDPDRFGTTIPLPSVARNDPDFSKDMWRGSVWVNTAYAVILGLERAGFVDHAAELAHRLVDGVFQTHANTHRVFEFYDPLRFDISELHRKKGNRWKHFTLGSKPRGEFVGWSGLVNTLVIEHLAGLTRIDGHWTIRPRLAEAFRGSGVLLRLPALGWTVEVERLANGAHRGVIRTPAGVRRFTLERGRSARIDELTLEPTPEHGHTEKPNHARV
jgi:hypothetical protein